MNDTPKAKQKALIFERERFLLQQGKCVNDTQKAKQKALILERERFVMQQG
jgi:hypothetical protein